MGDRHKIDYPTVAAQQSLPSDDEVGRMCERLNEHADCTDNGGCAEREAVEQRERAEEAAEIAIAENRELRTRAERAEAALAEANKALEPFAREAEYYGSDEITPFIDLGCGEFREAEYSAADLRAARRAHSKDGGEQ